MDDDRFWSKVVAQGVVLRFVSLEGLGLEAVRERQLDGCKDCDSDRSLPMLQASWCSMKLSTLIKERNISNHFLVMQIITTTCLNKSKVVMILGVMEKVKKKGQLHQMLKILSLSLMNVGTSNKNEKQT